MDITNPLEISGNRQDGRSFFAEIPVAHEVPILDACHVDYHRQIGELDQLRNSAFLHEDRERLHEVDLRTMALEAEHARRISRIKTASQAGGLVISAVEGSELRNL